MARDVAAPLPAVDIGTYAEILGRTWRRGEAGVARELAERRLAADDWESARGYWTAAIDEQVAHGGKDLVLAFAARFETARRADDRDSPAAPAEAPPVLIEAPVEVRAVAVAVPTYLATAAPTLGPPSGGADMLPAPPIHAADLAAHGPDAGDATLPPVTRTAPALPFAPTPQGAVPASVEALKGAGRRDPDSPSENGDETAFLPASALRDKLALPFQGASSPAASPPELSLREYARFLVAFAAVNDADAEAVRSRFGIASAAMQRTMGAAFAARFEREPAARAEFDAILAELRRKGTR